MKSNIFRKSLASAVALSVATLPWIVNAQNQVSSGLEGSGLRSIFGTSGLTGSTDAKTLIANVIRIMLLFAGAIAVLFIIIGGYQYLTSGGNEESAEKGRKTLTNALIGVVIVILAYVIVSVVVNLVSRSSF